jgi:hypothetical protein
MQPPRGPRPPPPGRAAREEAAEQAPPRLRSDDRTLAIVLAAAGVLTAAVGGSALLAYAGPGLPLWGRKPEPRALLTSQERAPSPETSRATPGGSPALTQAQQPVDQLPARPGPQPAQLVQPQAPAPARPQASDSWRKMPKMKLEAIYSGPLRDTIIQRWRDPMDGTVCHLYLPIIAPTSPVQPNGFVHYGPNGIGSISCQSPPPPAAVPRTAERRPPAQARKLAAPAPDRRQKMGGGPMPMAGPPTP